MSSSPQYKYCGCCGKMPHAVFHRRSTPIMAHANDIIHVPIHFHVFVSNLSETVVKDCYDALNQAFLGSNDVEQSKIPNTSAYPWKPVSGIPNITFDAYQQDGTFNMTTYDPVDLSSYEHPVEAYFDAVHPLPNMINVYIGETIDNTLGEAYLQSNVCFVYHASVGGHEHPGSLAGYNLGKTLVHEIGHCFGLYHPFDDAECDGNPRFLDIPEQIQPNFVTKLYFDEVAQHWTCKDDNRYNDRIYNTETSCLDLSSPVNEMGINYMDYGTDDVSIIFTKEQCALMRDTVLNTDIVQYTITHYGGEDGNDNTTTEDTNSEEVCIDAEDTNCHDTNDEVVICEDCDEIHIVEEVSSSSWWWLILLLLVLLLLALSFGSSSSSSSSSLAFESGGVNTNPMMI